MKFDDFQKDQRKPIILATKRFKKCKIQKWPETSYRSPYYYNGHKRTLFKAQIEGNFQNRNLSKECDFTSKNIKKTKSPKMTFLYFSLSAWVGGWIGEWWVLIKTVLRFFSFSGILTSKICWLQIWPQKLSTAMRSKVMSNLNLKFWNFNADFRGGE